MAAPCRIGTLLARDPLGPAGRPDAQLGRGDAGELPPASPRCPQGDGGVGAACTPLPPPAPFRPGPLASSPWGSEHPEPLGTPGAVGRGPPENPPSPPRLMPGGTLLGRGTHPAPSTSPGWGGRAQPTPRPLGVSPAFPPHYTGQEAQGVAGEGGPAPSDPPLSQHNEPGREGRFLRGARAGAGVGRGSLPPPPSRHAPGPGGSPGPPPTPRWGSRHFRGRVGSREGTLGGGGRLL